jgi:Uma2 family endonuclease
VLYHALFDVYLTETDVFQLDILIVLNERLHILTEAGAEGCPDFVVEILSPKTRRLDLENKMRTYARQGVQELWIIDPDSFQLLAYQLRLPPKNSAAVCREEFKDSLFRLIYFKSGS